jgi:transcriptional regulator with GAF, ATPase, and Fis domain
MIIKIDRSEPDQNSSSSGEGLLREQLRFEELVANHSARCVNHNPNQLDRTIADALKMLLLFFKVNYCGFLEVVPNKRQIRVLHIACEKKPRSDVSGIDIVAIYPQAYGRTVGGMEPIVFLQPESVPPVKDTERAIWQIWESLTLCMIPLYTDKRVTHCMGFWSEAGNRLWPPVYADRVRLLGTIFVRALSHNHNQEALKISENKLAETQLGNNGNIFLREELSFGEAFTNIVGTSEPIRKIILKIRQVAPMNTTVLLTGETGAGKGVFARVLHDSSKRSGKPFVHVNCAGLPANLIESELFGREKGAFTGATEKQIGRFELANGGTIFLDEIGELPIDLQAKLLKVIESGEFERLGNPHTVKVDARIIASTNRRLKDQIKKGLFRRDLFYRLNVFPINIPPLRERREDIPLFVKYFVDKFNKRCSKQVTEVPSETMDALQAYEWPGNVRELMNVIERSVIISNSPVLQIADHADISIPGRGEVLPLHYAAATMNGLAEMERDHIMEILRNTGWKIEGSCGSAHALGLKPSTLRARMKKLHIKRPEKS